MSLRLTPTALAVALLIPSVQASAADPSPTIVVTAPGGDALIPQEAASATRTATPLQETPQSVQVLPRGVLEQQRSVTLSEALGNVSGVQSAPVLNFDGPGSTTVRGFAGERYLDGLPSLMSAGDRDSLVNTERVEVLKGPTSALYGGGLGAPVGGLVNSVSKRPTSAPATVVGLAAGSQGFLAPYLDLNQPLGGGVLARVTAEYGRAGSFIDVVQTERWSVNPTLSFGHGTDTELLLQGRWSVRRRNGG